MTEPPAESEQCVGCGRVVSIDAPEHIYWEALGEDGAQSICEGCITGEEQQEMDQDAYETEVLVHLDPDLQD